MVIRLLNWESTSERKKILRYASFSEMRASITSPALLDTCCRPTTCLASRFVPKNTLHGAGIDLAAPADLSNPDEKNIGIKIAQVSSQNSYQDTSVSLDHSASLHWRAVTEANETTILSFPQDPEAWTYLSPSCPAPTVPEKNPGLTCQMFDSLVLVHTTQTGQVRVSLLWAVFCEGTVLPRSTTPLDMRTGSLP
jgi:hypothetical protein